MCRLTEYNVSPKLAFHSRLEFVRKSTKRMMNSGSLQPYCVPQRGCRVVSFGRREFSRLLEKRSRFDNFSTKGCRKSSFGRKKVCGTLNLRNWSITSIFILFFASCSVLRVITNKIECKKRIREFFFKNYEMIENLKIFKLVHARVEPSYFYAIYNMEYKEHDGSTFE